MTSCLKSNKHLYIPASDVVKGDKENSTLVIEEFATTSYTPLIIFSIVKLIENPTRLSGGFSLQINENSLLRAPVPFAVSVTLELGTPRKWQADIEKSTRNNKK